jgi:hypothetical protein
MPRTALVGVPRTRGEATITMPSALHALAAPLSCRRAPLPTLDGDQGTTFSARRAGLSLGGP